VVETPKILAKFSVEDAQIHPNAIAGPAHRPGEKGENKTTKNIGAWRLAGPDELRLVAQLHAPEKLLRPVEPPLPPLRQGLPPTALPTRWSAVSEEERRRIGLFESACKCRLSIYGSEDDEQASSGDDDEGDDIAVELAEAAQLLDPEAEVSQWYKTPGLTPSF
jgi:hypothetical protein